MPVTTQQVLFDEATNILRPLIQDKKFIIEPNEQANSKGLVFGKLAWNLNPEQKFISVYFGKLSNGQFCFIPKADRLISGQIVAYMKKFPNKPTSLRYATVKSFKGNTSEKIGNYEFKKIRNYYIKKVSLPASPSPSRPCLFRDIIYYDPKTEIMDGWTSLSEEAIENAKKMFPDQYLGDKW